MRRIMSEVDVVRSLQLVREKIAAAAAGLPGPTPRLVAVSKTKPKELVIAAYNEGQRNFGENYIQELLDKANSPEILRDCPQIKWHFIGRLQSNKVAKLPKIPNLFMAETLESQKTASALNNAWTSSGLPPLNVMVQVNTSGEEQKNGIEPGDASQLVKFLMKECPSLKFAGLMTIGMAEHDNTGPNPDFVCLAKCREQVCNELGLKVSDVELSMGMSADFEEAIRMGSTNVRVGSTIFGQRNYAPKT
uniref:Pyridoxal phosphate homeostasis protein n=1 Tax=Amblyomma aureolatum TaxID=187763 RepID=A0A1E1XA47_9ACAR